MNQSFHKIIFLCLTVAFFTVPAFGLKLSGSEAELTTDPCAHPYTYSENFDVKDQLVVWVDNRDDVNWVPRVYATFLNDSNHTEYLIDVNATSAWMIRTDGRKIVYSIMEWYTERYMLRIADVNDINNPLIKDVNITGYYLGTIDIDNGVIAYHDRGDYSSIPERIYAFNAADPCSTRYLVREFTGNDYISSNISLDGNLLSYSGQDYNDVSYVWRYYLETANIADLNNPVITRNYLPTDNDTGVVTYIGSLDTSGSWLVACGSYLGTSGVFGIHNYQDSNSGNWSYSMLSEAYGEGTAARVDEPFAVWAVKGNKLMGAILFSSGRTTTSVLKDSNDPNWTIDGATVSGDKVVWGAHFYHYDSELGIEEYYSDLFGDTIQMECGDKGYSLADFNHDCKVDFVDFAMFADRWLDCTMPEDEDCIEGEVFSAGDNL